jgi:signal transduction histidine kinase
MLLAALALLPLAGLVFYNAVMQRREAAREAENDALRLVLVCANNEERMVDSADQLLALMAEIPGVRNLDARACGPLFMRMLGNERGYANLGLLDANGKVVASAKPVALPGPVGRRAFFKVALGSGRFGASDFEMEPDGNHAEMMCGDPVRAEDGHIEGVVFAEMDLGWMTDMNTRLGLPAAVTLGVVNSEGIILMRDPDPEHWVGKSVLRTAAGRTILQRRGSGTADEMGLDNVRRLLAFTPLDPLHGLGTYVSAGIPDKIAFAEARRSERRQMVMLAVFAIGALAAAWFAADFLVLRGVRMLLRATQKVAAGDLRTRAGPVYGGGEFRELAQAFDTMATSLEKQSGERDAAEQELERRVQQRTAELERTTEELRRSNAELEQFAYIASHDLQEPLRMVASYTQLLERRYADQLDDAGREFIGYAVDGAKRMQQFITGLLRYSRVGTEPRVLEAVNLGEAFEVAVANLRIAIEESGAKVESRELPVVQGDPRQLAQIFQNLIGNALKFRKPGEAPRVEVWADREGDSWRVSVRDNGIGLDPKFSERVFAIFQRLHTWDEYEGTGLGLAICKKIVERHGGRIWVESKEGEGATFSFTLPAADQASP